MNKNIYSTGYKITAAECVNEIDLSTLPKKIDKVITQTLAKQRKQKKW